MNKTKIKIDISLYFYNEFMIGGGKGTPEIDSYVLKDVNGRPYIPGSSLKGKLRYNLTCLYNSLNKNKCSFYDSQDEDCGCLVCDMFGEKENVKGNLYFSNLNLEGYEKDDMFSIRNGIQVNRYMQTTRDLSLFSIQTAGEAGASCFKGSISGYLNARDYKKQLVFLYTAFCLTDTLGANQSRGLGWLDDNSSFEIYADGRKISKNELKEWRDEIEI